MAKIAKSLASDEKLTVRTEIALPLSARGRSRAGALNKKFRRQFYSIVSSAFIGCLDLLVSAPRCTILRMARRPMSRSSNWTGWERLRVPGCRRVNRPGPVGSAGLDGSNHSIWETSACLVRHRPVGNSGTTVVPP